MFPAFTSRAMPRPGAVPQLLIAVAGTAFLAWGQWTRAPWLERADLAAQDHLIRTARAPAADPTLVFLARDTAAASLEVATDLEQLFDLREADADSRRALTLMAHEWPWSREIHALVLDRLIAAGARAVIFDFTFPKSSPNDDRFRASLERHRERVVVAGNLSDEAEGAAAVFTPPTATLIPPLRPRDPRIGFDNFWPDADGVVRHAQYRWALVHGVWSGEEERSLAARGLHAAGLGAHVPPGLAAHRLHFAGAPGTFAPRSIHEIFVPEYWRRNYANGAFFKDKIVIIGAAGNWQQDEHLTPVGLMPGPEIHLNALNAALTGAFLLDLSPRRGALLILLTGAAALLLRRGLRRPHVRLLAQLLVTAAWGALALQLVEHARMLVPLVGPLLAFNLVGFNGLAFDFLQERREKAQLRRTLERYVSRNVVEELVDNPEQLHRALGGEMRAVTILFSDIRGFTSRAHEMDSRALVAQLNEYFSAMVECVFRYGGTLDKFIGDAVMAVWGNAGRAEPATDARNAVRCARAMLVELERLNARWEREGRPPLDIGIGLNSGPVIVGNIGSPQRMEFTVIGDAVNIAWRVQERTKGAYRLLLCEDVLPLLGEEFATEFVGEMRPRGDVPIRFAHLVEPEEAEAVVAAGAGR